MGKVVQLLGDLKVQLEEDSHKEGLLYQTYNNWCDSQAQEAKTTIKAAQATIADIEALLQEQDAFRSKTSSEIETVIAEISENEKDLKEAQQVRAKEHQSYMGEEKEFVSAIEQLTAAIEVMQKKQPGSAPKAADFFTVASTLKHALERNPDIPLNGEQQQTLDNFFKATIAMKSQQMQGEAQPMSFLHVGGKLRQPEGGSSGVANTLQSILEQQKKNRDAAMAEEQKGQSAFELLQQSLTAEIADGNKAMQEKKSAVAKSQETSSQKSAELEGAKRTHETTQNYLDEVIAQCQEKAQDWKERQKIRTDEITAITEALEILTSPEAQQLATKQGLGTMFLQTRRSENRARRAARRAARALRPSSSPGLSLLAVSSRVMQASWGRSAADPFEGVRKMIQEMIVRLLNEAAEEAEHKSWCDTEMQKSSKSKKGREKDINQMK